MREYFPGRGVLVLSCALLVSGCALPVPIQIASWALDGISYLATQKSVTDHGLSFVTQKDCALWRGVQGEDICDSVDDAGTVSVAALGAPSEPSEPLQNFEIFDPSIDIAVLDTASGPDEVLAVDAAPVEMASIEPARVESKIVPVKSIAPVTVMAMTERILIPGRRSWSSNPDANLYYVIGSFQKRGNAKRLVKRFKALGPSVMASQVKGVETYRVAIGPFIRSERMSVDRAIRGAGISDTWAIRIDHSEWMVASSVEPRKVPVTGQEMPIAETAAISGHFNIGG